MDPNTSYFLAGILDIQGDLIRTMWIGSASTLLVVVGLLAQIHNLRKRLDKLEKK